MGYNQLEVEGYLALGKELKKIWEAVLDLMPLTNQLPKRVTKSLAKSRRYFEQFRSDAENEMFTRHANDPRCNIYVFYGQDPK